jgi:hypothetical protein
MSRNNLESAAATSSPMGESEAFHCESLTLPRGWGYIASKTPPSGWPRAPHRRTIIRCSKQIHQLVFFVLRRFFSFVALLDFFDFLQTFSFWSAQQAASRQQRRAAAAGSRQQSLLFDRQVPSSEQNLALSAAASITSLPPLGAPAYPPHPRPRLRRRPLPPHSTAPPLASRPVGKPNSAPPTHRPSHSD